MSKLRWAAATSVVVAAVAAAGCGGGGDGSGSDDANAGSIRGKTVTVWSYEGQPDRIAALQADLRDFTAKTGVKTKVVAIPDNQLATLITNGAAAGKLPDVVAGVPASDTLHYAQEGVFDPDAAQDVVNKLGPQTFSKTALQLATQDGKVAGVPSDGWGQLLIYRKDLFKQAGIPAPSEAIDALS